MASDWKEWRRTVGSQGQQQTIASEEKEEGEEKCINLK